MIFQEWKEAVETMKFHAQGRRYIISGSEKEVEKMKSLSAGTEKNPPSTPHTVHKVP